MTEGVAVLDLQLLAKMSQMRSGETTLDAFALGLVLASAPSRLEQMRAAQHQPERLAALAHAFKGVSSTCGLTQLAAVLKHIEHTARQQPDNAAAVAEAEAAIARTVLAINDYLEQKRTAAA